MFGEIEITIRRSSNQQIVDVLRIPNLIVNGAKTQICHLLAGDIGATGYHRNIKWMQFGTGTIPEDVEDTSLQLPITPIKAVTYTYSHEGLDDDYYVRFYSSLLQNQANGFPISEAGLLSEDFVLFSRKTFSAINKTVDYIFEFSWAIRC